MVKDSVVWLAAALLFVSGVMFAMLVKGAPRLPFEWVESSPGVAAWVQALGSICAVAAAVHIASSQRRAQLVSERSARHVRLATLNSLCVSLTEALNTENITNVALGPYVRKLNSLAASFETIDLLSLPEPELVEPTARLKLALNGYTKGFRASWGDAKSYTELLAEAARNIDQSAYFSSHESKRNVREIKRAANELIDLLRHT